MNTKEFGKRLEEIMAYYALSASAFAERINVQRSSISHVLSGRNKPSLDFITKLTTVLPNINLYWLLNGTENMLRNPTPESALSSTIVSSQKKTTSEIEDFSFLCQSCKQPIDRIVVFYKDGCFDNYIPKEKK
ncbi:MAG: helix-turn-helix transcriptional regulator [Bacteroidota bacterium]|nr:helix-turn-helix transcriptional regulator [Bacteroidota bacterium]